MANKYLDTAFVDKAIKFAVDAHHDTERRGKGFPYVIHVLEAMEIVASMTNDPELLAAAALHDTVEDTDVTIDQIRSEFGDRVAKLVAAESDELVEGMDETASWRGRKQAAIDRIRKSSHDAKIVAMGDKLSNMRAIRRDYGEIGDKLWDRFHAPNGKADHEWHYRGLADSLGELAGTDAYAEFCWCIKSVFGLPEYEKVDLDEYTESGGGYYSTTYIHKEGSSMIKLYGDYAPSSTPVREYKASKALERQDLEIPKALRLVTDGKRNGVEFEFVKDKKSIARAIADEPARLEEYAKLFAGMCRKLHSLPCETSLFPPVEENFLRGVAESKVLDEEEKGKVTRFINSVPHMTTCTHGDLHIGNVILAEGRKFWIDLSDFSYGNPLFDLGMTYFVSKCIEEKGLTEALFHMSREQMGKVWDIFAREYFGEGYDSAGAERELSKFAALYMIIFINRDGEDKMPWMQTFIRNKLIKEI